MQKLTKFLCLSMMIVLFGMTAACGQKGDLYLPENHVVQIDLG